GEFRRFLIPGFGPEYIDRRFGDAVHIQDVHIASRPVGNAARVVDRDIADPFFAEGPAFGAFARPGGEQPARLPEQRHRARVPGDVFNGRGVDDRFAGQMPDREAGTLNDQFSFFAFGVGDLRHEGARGGIEPIEPRYATFAFDF